MLLDTSAWIEYFKGSGKGTKVVSLLEDKKALYTCPLTIAEISHWCLKNKQEPLPFVRKIMTFSSVVDLNVYILVGSGKLYFEERKRNDKISMIDCIIYTTAQLHGLDLLTTDSDFRNLEGVEFL